MAMIESDTDALIAAYIEPGPRRTGRAHARLRGHAIPVWTHIAYWRAAEGDVERVAHDYEIPRPAVKAAIAYYQRHQTLIDDRIPAPGA